MTPPPFPRATRVCTPTRRESLAFCGRSRGDEATDESPDGVLGVPAGGDRRARPPRVSTGDGAGRGRTRGRRAQPSPQRHRPAAPTRRPTRSPRACGSIAAAQDPHEFDFGTDMMAWTLAMGHSMVRAGLACKERHNGRGGPTSCTRTTGWSLTRPSRWPNTSTYHWFPPSTPPRPARHSGWVSGPISRQVHAVESWLVRESDSLITCSASMSDEITELFGPGLAEIPGHPQRNRRRRYGRSRHVDPVTARRELLYLGRLEYEKGIHDAIAALPRIRRTHPGHDADHRRRRHPASIGCVEQARKHKVLKATTFVGTRRPRGARAAAAYRRRRGAAQPLRAVRHRRARGRRDRHPAGHLQCRRAGRGGDQRRRPAVVSRPAMSRAWPRRSAPCSTIPDAAQRRAMAARERLTSDFDWHTVAGETAQVYLAAKRARTRTAPRGESSSSTRCPTADSSTGIEPFRAYRRIWTRNGSASIPR